MPFTKYRLYHIHTTSNTCTQSQYSHMHTHARTHARTHTRTHAHNVYHRHGECHNGEDPVHKVLQENFGSGVRHDVHKEAEEEVGQVDPLQCNKRIAVVVAQHISLALRASTTVQCKMLDRM